MTTLKEIMSPKSIAIVGASDDKTRIGGRPLSNMIEKKFSGDIYPINPNRDHVQGMKAYPSLLDVKDDLDFILVAVPSKLVVSVLEQAVIKKAKTALIFSSGFSEIGGQGEVFQNEIKKINKKVKKLALAQTLSKKNHDKNLHILADVKKEIKKSIEVFSCRLWQLFAVEKIFKKNTALKAI